MYCWGSSVAPPRLAHYNHRHWVGVLLGGGAPNQQLESCSIDSSSQDDECRIMADVSEDANKRRRGSSWGFVSLVLSALSVLFPLIVIFLSGIPAWVANIIIVAVVGIPACGITSGITGIFRDSRRKYLSVLGIILNMLALGLCVLCYYVVNYIVNHLPT